jgi:hypothetical protein
MNKTPIRGLKDAGSWKSQWFVPVEVLIRPTSDRIPKKDKSRKKNRRKLKKGRTNRPSEGFQAKRIRRNPNDFAGS